MSNAINNKTNKLMIVTGVWLVLSLIGTVVLVAYSNSAGAQDHEARDLPDSLAAEMTPGRHTLLMFVHPKCPCSRSSLSELARLMMSCAKQVDARVYFFQPAGQPDDWSHTDLWNSAARIPGVSVARDVDGQHALSMQAETSGQVFLFDPQRKMVFRGGITAGRGHEGDNYGRTAVENIVLHNHAERSMTPVFGCTILEIPSGDHCEGPAK